MAKAKQEELVTLRDEFQKHLDADLSAFAAEVDGARKRVIAAANAATKDALAQQLSDEILKQVMQLKKEAAACPVVWDEKAPLRPDTRSGRIYLTKLFRAGLVKDLPQKNLVNVIDSCLKTTDQFLQESALTLCGRIDDAKVFTTLATKEALRSPEFRKVVLIRLPTLLASGSDTATVDGSKLLAVTADSYFADPQLSQAANLDRTIKEITNEKFRQTKEFVWFLAAATFSGSQVAERELFTLFASVQLPSHDLFYLKQAADRDYFNRMVGVIVAKRAGKDPVPVFHRCLDTIIAAKKGYDLFKIPDIADFLIGWFAAVDASFAPEALRI